MHGYENEVSSANQIGFGESAPGRNQKRDVVYFGNGYRCLARTRSNISEAAEWLPIGRASAAFARRS